MECKIIRTNEEFNDLREDWQRIEKTISTLSYFSTYKYNKLWWENFNDIHTLSLFIVVCTHNGLVVGIAPLQIARIKHHLYTCRTLQFLRAEGDYADFLIDYKAQSKPLKIIDALWKEISIHHNEFDEIHLTHICQHSLFVNYILTSKTNDKLAYLIECPYIDFGKYNHIEDYQKEFQPQKIKQYVNRLRREIDFRMDVKSGFDVHKLAEIHIAEKNYLHAKGQLTRHSLYEGEKMFKFLADVYKDNPDTLTYLLIDNKNDAIICFYTGYVWNNVFHSVTTGYNPEYAKYGVGKIFNSLIFEHNDLNNRWEIFDMGTGRYAWKFEMTDRFNLLYQYSDSNYKNKFHHFLTIFEALLIHIRKLLNDATSRK